MAARIPAEVPTRNRPMNDGASLNDDAVRMDAVAKVTGRAKYARDRYLPNGLFVRFVRCPFGAATLVSVDEAAAKAVPGVIEVTMSGDSGRYHGHPVGHVVAESPQALRRGLAALAPRWKAGPVTTTIEDGMEEPEAPLAVRRLLADAPHTLEAVYSTPVQTHSSLETHGNVVDHRGDEATVYASTQGTFASRDGFTRALELPESKFEVICEYVGGGFGSKLNGAGKEGMTAAEIGKRYLRPVYLFCDRAEEHLDTGNRPSSRSLVRVGFTDDGTILGGQVQTWGGVGVSRRGGGVAFPSGRYDLGDIAKAHEDVQFNAGAPRAFRAPGHPQAAFAEELMLDEIATVIDMDPLALRLKLDGEADRREMFELGARLIGWRDRRKTGSQTGVVRRGYGMGGTDWGRFPSRAEAEVVIHRDGSVEVRTGTQDIGTGQRTIMGVLAAKHVGVPLSVVDVRIGRSTLPLGPASGGSTTAHNCAPAMMAAADDARDRLLQALADQLGGDASDYAVQDGAIMKGGRRVLGWAEACAKLPGDHVTGRGEASRDTIGRYGGEGHSQGAQFAEVEVDTETGVVRVTRIVAIQSCGQVVCRRTAESQIIGGVIQGVSYALFENKILDRNVGAMVNPNLEMYKILGAADMPHIEPVLWTKGQTGVRSLGEPPTIPTAGAVACAVFNAIGAPVRHLPLTPDKVLDAVQGARA